MVRWVVGSILHGVPIELFLIPASAPRLVQQRPWYVLSCLWGGAYKIPLLLIGKSLLMWRQRVSSLAFRNKTFPSFLRNIIVDENVFLCVVKEGRKEMFYLTTHSTHFILRLYGVGHMVKDHSDSKRGNPLPPHGLLFPINSKGSFICIIAQTW